MIKIFKQLTNNTGSLIFRAAMKTKAHMKALKDSPEHPVHNLGSVFRTRRDLVRELERVVIKDRGYPLDLIDILCDLYGVRRLGWDDPASTNEGFVTVRALKDGLVHSGALLSIRLKKLVDDGLIEIRDIPKSGPGSQHRRGPRSSRSWVRILPRGEDVARIVWDRYSNLAERLLANVSKTDLAAHRRVNEMIRQRIVDPVSSPAARSSQPNKEHV